METYPVFCGRDCGGDACPLIATIENGRVVRVSNNPAGGRYVKGCRRGFNLPLLQNAPDRLLTPLIRTGRRGSGEFRPASWAEALHITAERLGEIRGKYGPATVLNMGSAGSTGALHGTGSLLSRFLHFFGGCTELTGSYSTGCARYILPFVLGNDWMRSGFDAATMAESQMIILWGANILDTRMGGEYPQRLIEARRRGIPIVVIDPRRSTTAKQAATWWIPCRPGTDSALMLAILHTMLIEGLVDREFIHAHSIGFEQLERYTLGKGGAEACTPKWAAAICGVPADDIIRFARLYAASKPAMVLPGYSIQRVFAGEEPFRLAVALQVATGNFGKRGGSTGSLNNRLPGPRVGVLDVPAGGHSYRIPILRWPEAVLAGRSEGYLSDIHAIYSLGSNFLNQGSDIRKNIAALEKVDFSVCHDLFLTPTARYCDVIFPAATPLEKEDIGIPWAGNYLLYKPRVLSPAGQARSDYDALCDLADHLGFWQEFSEGRTASAWIQKFLDDSEIEDIEVFRRTGIFFGTNQERVGLSDFATDPLKHPLSTTSGKVEIASDRYHRETGFSAAPGWQAPPKDEGYPLLLITPKSPLFTHSQGRNFPALQKKEPGVLSIHTQDAAIRGLRDGCRAAVFNSNGEAHISVRISEDLMPGVICLAEGIWVDLDESGIDRAGSANMFTDTRGTAPGTGCIMHGIGVEVRAL